MTQTLTQEQLLLPESMYLLHTSTLESSFDKKADFKPKSISREEERKKREKMSQDISFSLLLPCTRIPRPSLLPFFSLPLISFLERRLPHSLTHTRILSRKWKER